MQLLLTLGHHSSAILVSDEQVICGFEEERLSKVKSTSAYPILAIEKILSFAAYARDEVTDVYISHWFDLPWNFSESKYYQPKHIAARFPNAKVHSVYEKFTHHDAHAGSVWNFSGFSTGLTMVADGFGNNGETISIYEDGARVARYYGLSLGLMYQYATSYLGMKENQDEYKLLGYEANVTQEVADRLEKAISKYSVEIFHKITNSSESDKCSYVSLCANNREIFTNMLDHFVSLLYDLDEVRASIAYAVQSILEKVVLQLLRQHKGDNDILQFSGGVFYNVKLNNAILNTFASSVETIEFMPLAGDQGAAIGFLDKLDFNDFKWGLRDEGPIIYDSHDQHNITLVFDSVMEFGPRALGNTSCIASPTEEASRYINALNGRPNIMPMAPILSTEIAQENCLHVNKLGKCKHYMICATDWIGPIESCRGVLHKKPLSSVYTCRPQVVDNWITQKRGLAINTSLNAHGQPIIYSQEDFNIMVKIHEANSKVHCDSKISEQPVEGHN